MARYVLFGWLKALLVCVIIATGIYGAHAQVGPCHDRSALIEHLAEKYQEKQFAYGLVGTVAVVEIFVAENGTWTVIISDVSGRSCIVAAGNDWEIMVSGVGA